MFFCAGIGCKGIVAYNANVLVGWTVQSDHWGNKVFLLTNALVWPPLLYYLGCFLLEFFKRKDAVKKILSILGVFLVVSLTIHVVRSEVAENKSNASQYTVSSELMNAYGWLIANTPKDSVVVSPSLKTNIDIAAYTHNRILLARSQNNLISKNELLDRLYVTYALFEISPEIFFETINSSLGVYNFFTAEYNSKAIDSS